MSNVIKKKARFYRIEWKHPETRKWVQVCTDIPAPSRKKLVERTAQMESYEFKMFAGLDNEFERLSHLRTQWRVAPSKPDIDEISLSSFGDGFKIFLPDGTELPPNETDEILYFWIIEEVCGIQPY